MQWQVAAKSSVMYGLDITECLWIDFCHYLSSLHRTKVYLAGRNHTSYSVRNSLLINCHSEAPSLQEFGNNDWTVNRLKGLIAHAVLEMCMTSQISRWRPELLLMIHVRCQSTAAVVFIVSSMPVHETSFRLLIFGKTRKVCQQSILADYRE